MKKQIILIGLTALLSGCAGLFTQISFSKGDPYERNKVSGTVKARVRDVKEFRSLLESLEYRASEKAN